MKVIDLFSGAGGFSLGFIQNGFKVVKAVEFDSSIANTYAMNHPGVRVIVDDIMNVVQDQVFKEGDADVIIGGPPCQGFSMAGTRNRNGFMDDPRNYLFKHYFNIVKVVKPKVFVMENVKGIKTMQSGQIFEKILSIFSDADILDGKPYHLYHRVIKSAECGIPQKRERMIIIGTTLEGVDFDRLWEEARQEILFDIPAFFDDVSVRDAISNLSNTSENGQVLSNAPTSSYQEYLYTSSLSKLHNHTKTKHTNLAISRMQMVKMGENYTVLDEVIKSVHSGSYGRLSWDEKAPTITTRFDTPAGGRFIHPEMNRTLSPREAARIQSFPDDYIFYGTKTSICKQIGNAVPPKISYFLARVVANILNWGE